MSKIYYSKADTKYTVELHNTLIQEHFDKFKGCAKNLDNTIKSMKFWYMHLPKVGHPADMNPKTVARYYICSQYLHELIRYLHFINKFDEAVETYDIDDILKVEFLQPTSLT